MRAGVLPESKLRAALAEQQRWGGRLGRILVEMNFLSEDLLVKALCKQLGLPRATFQQMNVPQELIDRLGEDFCREQALCPEHLGADRTLVVAVADPGHVSAIEEVRVRTGLSVSISLGGELQITRAIDRFIARNDEPAPEAFWARDATGSGAGQTAAPARAPSPPASAARPAEPRTATPVVAGAPASAPTASAAPAAAPAALPPTPASASASATAPAGEDAPLAATEALKLRALIDLLVEKKVFTRQEFDWWRQRPPGM